MSSSTSAQGQSGNNTPAQNNQKADDKGQPQAKPKKNPGAMGGGWTVASGPFGSYVKSQTEDKRTPPVESSNPGQWKSKHEPEKKAEEKSEGKPKDEYNPDLER